MIVPMSRRAPEAELDELSAPLRADVRHLTSALGEIIVENSGADLLEDVRGILAAAVAISSAGRATGAPRLPATSAPG